MKNGDKTQEVEAYHGETLRLYRVTRQMMAAYMCIASNDVPPAVSKRVPLNVNCKFVSSSYTTSRWWLSFIWRCLNPAATVK